MFTAALFTISKIRKQPKCPSTDGQIKMMWYLYTMEHYSVIKRIQFCHNWMDLEGMISEISQRMTNTVLYHFYVESKKCN